MRLEQHKLKRIDVAGGPDFVPGVRGLAALFETVEGKRISAPAVTQNWVTDPDFPPKTKDGFDVAAVCEWLEGKGAFEPEPTTIQEARLRKTLADAEKQELAVAEKKGLLVDVTKIQGAWGSMLAKSDQEAEKAFYKLAPKLSGMDAPAIVVELQDWYRGYRRLLADDQAERAKT